MGFKVPTAKPPPELCCLSPTRDAYLTLGLHDVKNAGITELRCVLPKDEKVRCDEKLTLIC